MPVIFEDYRRKRRTRRVWTGVAGVGVASASALIALSYQGWTAPAGPSPSQSIVTSAATGAATNPQPAHRKVQPESASGTTGEIRYGCTVVDGDTLRCDSERVRLLGIDAPELPGHCRPGRHCVAGDPVAASEALREGIAGREVKLERMRFDRYGRTLASAYVSGRNVACELINKGHAQYVERWDDGGRVAADCKVVL